MEVKLSTLKLYIEKLANSALFWVGIYRELISNWFSTTFIRTFFFHTTYVLGYTRTNEIGNPRLNFNQLRATQKKIGDEKMRRRTQISDIIERIVKLKWNWSWQ